MEPREANEDCFFILLSKILNHESSQRLFEQSSRTRPEGIRHPARCSADARAPARFWARMPGHFQLGWTTNDRDRKMSIARIINNNNFNIYAYIHENNKRHDYIYLIIVLDIYCLDDVIGLPSPPAHAAGICQREELECAVSGLSRGGGGMLPRTLRQPTDQHIAGERWKSTVRRYPSFVDWTKADEDIGHRVLAGGKLGFIVKIGQEVLYS
jgi:hypothetical protein